MHENYDLDLLLELVEQRKFRSLKELLSQMNEVDIAEFLDELDVEQEILVFRLLPKDTAAEVIHLPGEHRGPGEADRGPQRQGAAGGAGRAVPG